MKGGPEAALRFALSAGCSYFVCFLAPKACLRSFS
jgi:hypothetical protein